MGTHFKGNKKEEIALESWIKLQRASNSVFRNIRPSMVQYTLSTTQFAVLEVLLHLGPLSQKVIGQKLLISSGNTVKVIDNLERDKLVSREPDPNDRRAYKVILTKEGERIIKKIFPAHVKSIVESFSILTKKEQVELSRLCKKLGIGLENYSK
jgi:MarR family 2-MHQ and catechol resistance regulon transcriptional repressor